MSFFVITTVEIRSVLLLRPVHEVLTTHFELNYKTFNSKRDEYFYTAVQSIIDRPIGYGPGNYLYVSEHYSNGKYPITETSHSIFLDLLIENGIVAGVSFIILLGWLLYSANRANTLFYAALALFINFQTDYTYRLFSLFLLLLILLALLFRRHNHGESKSKSLFSIIWIISFIVFLGVQWLVVSGSLLE
jgi:hypothetical protein